MTTDMPPHKHTGLLQTALIKLIRLAKAVRFYPTGHPALAQAGEEALTSLQPLLQNGNLTLTVRKEGILLGDTVIAPQHPEIRNLAHLLFARRVQQLLLLSDLTISDLDIFCRNLARPVAEIRALGGFQELLLAERATGIWINELDLSVIQAARERLRQQMDNVSVGLEEKLPEETSSSRQILFQQGVATEVTGDALLSDQQIDRLSLAQILARLPGEVSDTRFRQMLNRLPALLHEHLQSPSLPLVLQTFLTMATLLGKGRLNKVRRGDALRCLQQLVKPQLLDYLIDSLCTRGTPKPQRERCMQTLVFLREKAVAPLLGRLTREEETLARKLLSTTLVKLGEIALPEMLPMLQDERWYVVRNIIIILGQIEAPHIAPHLLPLLWHSDLRIAREAIRALTRIGGKETVEALLQLVDKGPRELYPQAIIALGIMRHPAAVPSLLKILKSFDPFMQQAELKTAAIKALGRIGSQQAAPALERLARHRLPWGRARRKTLRIHAIAALALIASPSSRAVLRTVARGRDRQVAQASLRTLQSWPDS